METITSRDGTRIAYDQTGSGPALIIVYGAMNTRSSGSLPELVGLLAPHFTVYSYDRRGRGDSGDTLPYAVGREIEDIEAVIGQAGGTAFLYGHSSGGCLALEAARKLGSQVGRVAVYEAPYDDEPEAQQTWSQYLDQLEEALATERLGDAAALFMRYVGMPAEQVEGMRQAPFWPAMEAVAPTLAYDHAGVIGRSRAVPRDRLAEIEAPVLALCGGSRPAFMHNTARTISQAAPKAEFRMLDGQTHEVQPAVLAPVLIEFLRS
ncbi:MAG: alpha/beta hydrolase [Actinobacteria bacterium]|nr:alpha/beta hydrolase [Actinomycetota bacterium]